MTIRKKRERKRSSVKCVKWEIYRAYLTTALLVTEMPFLTWLRLLTMVFR